MGNAGLGPGARRGAAAYYTPTKTRQNLYYFNPLILNIYETTIDYYYSAVRTYEPCARAKNINYIC